MRKTFTDYIDDVSSKYYDPAVLAKQRGHLAAAVADPSIGKDKSYSDVGKQRGDSGNKDWYSFFGIVLTIRINKANTCTGALKMGGG